MVANLTHGLKLIKRESIRCLKQYICYYVIDASFKSLAANNHLKKYNYFLSLDIKTHFKITPTTSHEEAMAANHKKVIIIIIIINVKSSEDSENNYCH